MNFRKPGTSCLKLLLLLALLATPGCESSSGTSSTQGSTEATLASGNGGGYEGLNRQYYRFIPGYSCEGKPATKELVLVDPKGVRLFENKSNQCDAVGRLLLPSEIGTSPFEREFISVADRLFKLYPDRPAGIPDSLAEVLCRDDFEHPSFEIVAHYDREKNLALARSYSAAGGQPDFPVSRLLSSDRVRYASDRLVFHVDLDSSAKRLAGTIESSSVSGVSSGTSLSCVIGGSLDTSNWKIRKSPLNTTRNTFMIFNDEVIFSRELPISQYYSYQHFYKWAADDSVTDFSKAILGDSYYTDAHIPMDDKSLLVFEALGGGGPYKNWYLYDSKTLRTTRLTGLQPGPAVYSYFRQFPEVSSNRTLVYLESTIDNTGFLRTLDLADGSISTILADPNASFKLLPKANKVIVASAAGSYRVYDLITRSWSELPTSPRDGCAVAPGFPQLFDDENLLLVPLSCDGVAYSSMGLLPSSGGSALSLGKAKAVTWSSDDHRWLITSDYSSKSVFDPAIGYDRFLTTYSNPVLVEAKTGKSIPIQVDPRLGYNEEYGANFGEMQFPARIAMADGKLYGFSGDAIRPTLLQVDTSTGASVPACEDAAGTKRFVGTLPNQKVFLFTYDAALKTYRFYQVKGAKDCPRLNEFPNPNPFVTNILAIDQGFILALAEPDPRYVVSVPSNDIRDIVYVPIDGRPPLKLNPNYGKPWHVEVSPSLNRIFFVGPVSGSESQIFSFDLNYD